MFEDFLINPWKNNLFIQCNEEDGYYIAEVVIAGSSKKDISLSVTRKILTLSFEGNDYVPKFKKEWMLEDETTSEDISGKLEKGVMTIKVKKPEIKTETIKVE